MNRSLSIILLIVALALLGACSSSRKGSGHVDIGGLKKEAYTVPEMVRGLNARAGDWESVRIPVSVSLKSPVSMKLSGTLSMVRDREILLSLRFFGFEVAAARISDDSIQAYAKQPSKLYVSESVSDLLGGFPVNVGNLQSVILGQIFMAGSRDLDIGRCTVAFRPEDYTVTPPAPRKGISYSFTAATADNLLRTLSVNHTGGASGSVEYTYDSTTPERGLPGEIEVQGTMNKRKVELGLTLNTGKTEWDRAENRKFTIPSGCRKVKASALLKLLSSGN
ncbi:MAG: DUF4292 domain-containing protein [Muribaculaceae bacterium]|nr:DUF4292 domain-containing protein [Muribaculaceae bacterium]